MKEPPVLTEAEWGVVEDLLRLELEELPAEIHHTEKLELRDELRQRRKLIEHLLERRQMAKAAN